MRVRGSWVVLACLAARASAAAPPGEKLFLLHCSVCHGERGDGQSSAASSLKPPPRNFRDPAVIASLTRERMLASIRDGRPGTGMQPFGARLAPSEIDAVIDYIRGAFMQLPEELRKGRVEEGRGIYNERCYVCHGYQGDARTEAALVLRPRPRAFTDPAEMSGIDRDRMLQSIRLGRAGTGMKPFAGVISEVEIEAVVDFILYVFVEKQAENIRYHSPQNGWVDFDAQNPDAIAWFHHAPGATLSESLLRGRAIFEHSCVTCHLATQTSTVHSSPFKKRTAPPAPASQVE